MKPVAATVAPERAAVGVADALAVERTTCEDRELLITTEGMDFWLKVCRNEATHALFWPGALMINIIGPHMYNVVIGARLLHGTAATLSTWATVATQMNWTK
jgi:hypothetical protein